jgi:putative ABC transport system substrate-binding protein
MATATNRPAIIGTLIIGAVLIAFIIASKFFSRTYDYNIGIVTTISHPALDKAQAGFIDYLREKLGNKIGFTVKNAQGLPAQAHLIAQSFETDTKLNGVFAIASLAFQSMLQSSLDRPLFFAAVTDPIAAGARTSQKNICGVSDIIDAQKQVTLIKALVPNAQKITLFYHIGDGSAKITGKLLYDALRAAHYTVQEVTFTQLSDIPIALEKALKMSDVLLTPIDNSVAAAIALIAQKAVESNVPLIVSDNLLVKEGALAAYGTDYYQLGREAGRCAYEVLVEHKSPHELGFIKSSADQIMINLKVLEKLHLDYPAWLNDDFIDAIFV